MVMESFVCVKVRLIEKDAIKFYLFNRKLSVTLNLI